MRATSMVLGSTRLYSKLSLSLGDDGLGSVTATAPTQWLTDVNLIVGCSSTITGVGKRKFCTRCLSSCRRVLVACARVCYVCLSYVCARVC